MTVDVNKEYGLGIVSVGYSAMFSKERYLAINIIPAVTLTRQRIVSDDDHWTITTVYVSWLCFAAFIKFQKPC